MEQHKIKKTIIRIFNSTDKRNWKAVLGCFADEVLLDYSSMNEQPATIQKATDIISSWSDFLPKFKFTLHTLTNFEIKVSENSATVFCKGQALHHLPDAEGGDLWNVYGTYDFELEKTEEIWEVTAMKFDLLYQDGNKDLPVLAMAAK